MLIASEPFTIMGVVNVTPDSFSDGGNYLTVSAALKHAQLQIEQGAEIIDIGAESSRPGATPVSVEEEWRRLEPVLECLQNTGIPISVDSYKPAIIDRLLDFPVTMINDTRALNDRRLLAKIAKRGLSYLTMHMTGTPQTMQQQPLPKDNVIPTLMNFFRQRLALLLQCGFTEEQLWIDPGFGFGKSDEALMEICLQLRQFSDLANLAIGVSRKSWFGRNFSITDPVDRDAVSSMMGLALVWQGAKLVRTHDVATVNRLRSLMH